MKNKDLWHPSKYVLQKGVLRASRNPREVGIASRLVADIVAGLYWDHLKEHCRGRLLDLGCGKVPLFEAYRELIDENICVDWENSLHGNSFLDHNCDLTQALPFSDGEFDTIILSDVLEHLPEPMNFWQEMNRVLNAGGKIFINVPFYYWLHEKPHDYYRYTEFALKRFAEMTGFEIITLRPIGGSPEIIADILSKTLMTWPKLGKYPAMAIQFMCWKFINTGPGRSASGRSAQYFPLGYFMIVRKL